MATRLVAGAFLLASGLLAWLAVTSTLAARLLQAAIGISVVYVGYLALRGWQLFVDSTRPAAPSPLGDGSLPFMSVVVPARDEAQVIAGIVGDLVAQTYSPGMRQADAAHPASGPRFEVVIVDDGSDDGTGQIATTAALAAGATPGLVRVIRRDPGSGPRTKGAALAAAMPHLHGEAVAVLDADSRVGPDFLAAMASAWRRDASAAAIQARRQPINAAASWLTGAQADELLMDLASQCGRRRVDGTAELRGNGMFVRTSVLERVGGWSASAITEDLELSTRLATAGEHVAMAPEVIVGEEAVERPGSLWRQRLRWAEGSMRRLMEHGPTLFGGSAPLSRKLDFLAFTGEFIIPPLFATSIVASLLTIPLPARMDWTVPVSLFLGYGAGSFLLALAGLAASGVRGAPLLGRATRGALFLSHWLVVVPVVLARIAVAPPTRAFHKTPRIGRRPPTR